MSLSVAAWLDRMIPWFRRSDYQMPAREVEDLTLRQADAYVMDWVRRQGGS